MAETIGNIIKRFRMKRRKTQTALADATNIPAARISKIESGTIKPTVNEIAAIARYFESLEIIREYWISSELHDASKYICGRMGLPLESVIEITARQFGTDMINRSHRIMQLCGSLPPDDTRQENILLAGQEALQIQNLATAFRILICDITG